MLASLLLKIGFSCMSADQERPECLLMPDSRSLSCSHSYSIFLCFAHVIHCIGETVKVLYNAFVVISLNPVHHQHFHRLIEVREALRALYLKSDSSRFQYLLGFRNVAAGIIEDEIRPDVAEVLRDIEVYEEKRPFDTKDDLLDKIWKNDNIDKTKVTKSEEPIDFDEDKNDLKKKISPDIALHLKENGSIQDSLRCVKCDKKFMYGAAFRRHNMKHKEKEEEVERKRIRRENVRIRKKRRVVCERCSKSVLVNKLKMHIKAHDRKDSAPQQNFNCTMCRSGRHKTEATLQRHVMKCHSGLVYQCELCDNTSTSPHAKRLHFRNQHGEKPLQCNSCYRRFSANSFLTAHIKQKHEKVKDKKCPHCAEEFPASIAFQAHVNRHTDNRPFACEICGKSFLVQAHFKAHAKTHTLPYSCDKCDLMFGSDGTLKKHTRIEHEKQQIHCRHGCGFSCWESSNRNRHEKKSCKKNPLPDAPYSVAAGTASSLTLQVSIYNLKKY